jgi:hypothetical protein
VLRDELPPGERAGLSGSRAPCGSIRAPPGCSETGSRLRGAAAHPRAPRRRGTGAFLAGDSTGGVDRVLGC